jgi:3-oxoacyl-(acyl-carrier-protein) synthase
MTRGHRSSTARENGSRSSGCSSDPAVHDRQSGRPRTVAATTRASLQNRKEQPPSTYGTCQDIPNLKSMARAIRTQIHVGIRGLSFKMSTECATSRRCCRLRSGQWWRSLQA